MEAPGTAPVTYESVIPNPKAKLLEQIREVMRLKHYSIRSERSYCGRVTHRMGTNVEHPTSNAQL